MQWSKEQIERLMELAKEGIPNKNIADQIGIDVVFIYSKRSQLGITIDKIKTAISDDEISKTLEANKERFIQNRILDKKRKLVSLLEPVVKHADESVNFLTLGEQGNVVRVDFKNGAHKIINVECDSLMAIIADVTHKLLY